MTFSAVASNGGSEVNHEEPDITTHPAISDARHVDGPTARHQSGPTGLGDIAHFERSARVSWQRRFDDHSGVSTWRRGSHPPSQCTCLHLCVGGLDNHAGERWKGSDADTGADFL